MKIAYSGRLAAPMTGAEIVPIEILKRLLGHKGSTEYLVFLSAENAHLFDGSVRQPARLFHRRFWNRPIPNLLWHQAILPLLLQRHKIDVLWTTHNRAPFLKTTRQVVMLHDLAEHHVSAKYSLLRQLFRKSICRRVVRRADLIVTVSESSKRDIVRYCNTSPECVKVVYNGVADEFFSRTDEATTRRYLRERLDIYENYILYVGALEQPNKNIVRLLHAYRRARDVGGVSQRLYLVGPKRHRPEEIFSTITELSLHDSVRWLGYVPREDLPYIYRGADLFVYVSLYEGFGLPVLEAMASGVPVVASNTSSIPEVVGDCATLVDPTDIDAIADAIVRLLRDTETRGAFARAGTERARQFSWEHAATQMQAIFGAMSSRT